MLITLPPSTVLYKPNILLLSSHIVMLGKQFFFFGPAFKDVEGLLSLKTDQAAGDGTWDSAHARQAIPITAVTLILSFKCLRVLHYH